MDKRGWPWKKKPVSEIHIEKGVKEEKRPKYVQISVESYAHLTSLEDQVKDYEEQVRALEDEVKELNERLTEADSELTNKEGLVKQHTKVAEEAVSGWEKADAEAAALKNHLESVTLLKLTAEDRASQLDTALKECMKQIRSLKDEHEQKLQDLAASKAKQFDKMKHELESKLFTLDQELLRYESDNAAISRSLQQRSNALVHLSEEKSQAEAQIELLKSTIEAYDKEVNSLKYELHIARKEAEIRNEERNMSVRSAEVANKQHLDAVKKIAKLEAECQRLRGLVRKKLPGPAALAQMKLEVESLGRDYGDSRLRRSPGRLLSPQSPDFGLESSLTERLISVVEENRVLKEALAKRNTELQTARSLYALAASKLQSLEADSAQVQKADSLFSEEGVEDTVSSAGSWSAGLLSEKNAPVSGPRKGDNAKSLDLMDDFLEMEKLAYSTNESNGTVSDADIEKTEARLSRELHKTRLGSDPHILVELQGLLTTVLESKDEERIAKNVQRLIKGMRGYLRLDDDRIWNSETELKSAVSRVCEFVRMLGSEAKLIPELESSIDTICSKYKGTDIDPIEFVIDVSNVFSEASKLHFNVLGFKRSESETETSPSDCIDKIALPENNATVDDDSTEEESYPRNSKFSDHPEVPNVPVSDVSASFEQLKTEKDTLVAELERCKENFETAKSQLSETENLLADIKAQLSSALKTNSLAETQLKCMAESYKSLEKRSEELEIEVNRLQGRVESLENELQDVRKNREEALSRCKELEEPLQRIDDSATADVDDKPSQEKELAAASEKLAECQETIILLGQQLKSLQTPPEAIGSVTNGRTLRVEMNANPEDVTDIDSGGSFLQFQKPALDSPLSDQNDAPLSPETRHKTVSGSSTPDKHARGFSRFFSASTKGK